MLHALRYPIIKIMFRVIGKGLSRDGILKMKKTMVIINHQERHCQSMPLLQLLCVNVDCLLRAAFQYGVKMNDGRKTRRQGAKNEKAKLDREWQQISQVSVINVM